MPVTGDPTDPEARVMGTVDRQVSGDAFRWDLRRVAAGVPPEGLTDLHLLGHRDEAVGCCCAV
ncbi:hypothetical protein O7634_25255 [Micromonospora sp. WMMD1120]|uniref:hypothetical protein n=1 Tax=Micromonospora sp. WMMD1120 TaxID=3016106 RepID=UPI002415E613|nr:hypothetical protein [Micromonospora sp. WMMD1120]MDG4810074.1 hypothetical protein [Micromonospora sp. WMMD1120]